MLDCNPALAALAWPEPFHARLSSTSSRCQEARSSYAHTSFRAWREGGPAFVLGAPVYAFVRTGYRPATVAAAVAKHIDHSKQALLDSLARDSRH